MSKLNLNSNLNDDSSSHIVLIQEHVHTVVKNAYLHVGRYKALHQSLGRY